MKHLLDGGGNRMYVGDMVMYAALDGTDYWGTVSEHPDDDFLVIDWKGHLARVEYKISSWNKQFANLAMKVGGIHKRFEFG